MPFPESPDLPPLRQVQPSTDVSERSPTFVVPKPDMDILKAHARRTDRNLLAAEKVTLQELREKYSKQRPRRLPDLSTGSGFQVESKERQVRVVRGGDRESERARGRSQLRWISRMGSSW
jgi:hypothetical protein